MKHLALRRDKHTRCFIKVHPEIPKTVRLILAVAADGMDPGVENIWRCFEVIEVPSMPATRFRIAPLGHRDSMDRREAKAGFFKQFSLCSINGQLIRLDRTAWNLNRSLR